MVWTDLVVVVGLESAMQPVLPSGGPNVGGSADQVLPQCANTRTVKENETDRVNKKINNIFIADLRSSLAPSSFAGAEFGLFEFLLKTADLLPPFRLQRSLSRGKLFDHVESHPVSK